MNTSALRYELISVRANLISELKEKISYKIEIMSMRHRCGMGFSASGVEAVSNMKSDVSSLEHPVKLSIEDYKWLEKDIQKSEGVSYVYNMSL